MEPDNAMGFTITRKFLKSNRKSASFVYSKQDLSCPNCKAAFKVTIPNHKSNCALCNISYCLNCLPNKVPLLTNSNSSQQICSKCYESCWGMPEVKLLDTKFQEAVMEYQETLQKTNEIDLKRKEALERLRSLNLTFSKIQDDWAEKTEKMQEEALTLHAENIEIENHCKELNEIKGHKLQEIEETNSTIALLNQEIEESKAQNLRDIERISQLEVLIREQTNENHKISESLKKAEMDKKENEETLKTDEAGLNLKLNKLKEHTEELRKQNEVLRKRLKESRKDEGDEAYPRSVESRGDSYKRLMEQWTQQEYELQQLRSQPPHSPITEKTCKCNIQ